MLGIESGMDFDQKTVFFTQRLIPIKKLRIEGVMNCTRNEVL